MDTKNLKDFGMFTTISFGFGPMSAPEWIGMEVVAQEGKMAIAFPSLNAVEMAGMVLELGQKQAANLPKEQLLENRKRHLLARLTAPVTVKGVKYQKDEKELELDLGIGILRFALEDVSRDELGKIAAAL